MMPIKIEKIEAMPMPVKSELEFVRERLAKAEDEITLLRETILELKVSLSTARLLAKEKAQLVLKLDEEVAQSLRERIGLVRVSASTRGDGLDTLSVTVGEQAICIDGERSPAFLVIEDSADTVEVLSDAALAVGVDVELEVHGHKEITNDRRDQISRRSKL